MKWQGDEKGVYDIPFEHMHARELLDLGRGFRQPWTRRGQRDHSRPNQIINNFYHNKTNSKTHQSDHHPSFYSYQPVKPNWDSSTHGRYWYPAYDTKIWNSSCAFFSRTVNLDDIHTLTFQLNRPVQLLCHRLNIWKMIVWKSDVGS